MNRDVGVGKLVDDLQQRGDRLPFEVGAFVALEACEGLLQDAVRLNPDDIRVTLEGSVVVSPEAERTGPDEAARSLVSVLSRLLVAAGPGVPPSLAKIVEDGSLPNSQQDLQRLHDLIEASLIPLNRGASTRSYKLGSRRRTRSCSTQARKRRFGDLQTRTSTRWSPRPSPCRGRSPPRFPSEMILPRTRTQRS